MTHEKRDIELRFADTSSRCPIGETVGKRCMEQSKIPVLSCEGACIRGEIARQAANMVAGEAPYGRGCHGELLTVPDSSIVEPAPELLTTDRPDGIRCAWRSGP